jgi:hypothetical protein
MPPVPYVGIKSSSTPKRKHPSTFAHCQVCFDALVTTSWQVPEDVRPYTRRQMALQTKSVRFLLVKAEKQVYSNARCGSCRLILEIARHFNPELNTLSSLSNIEALLREEGKSSYHLSLKLLSSKKFALDEDFAAVNISLDDDGKANSQSTVVLHCR